MKKQEVMQFYQEQFNLLPEVFKKDPLYFDLTKEINEQIGKPFTSVLELGAGNGLLAQSMATFQKEITTIELVPALVDFAKQQNNPSITSLCGSFYDIELPKTFDVVLYMDGFGVGEDADQLQVLQRIYHWLTAEGTGLIDIYAPKYWQQVSGQEMTLTSDGNVKRVYGYDHKKQRMTDRWWEADRPEAAVTQSLACYRVEEIHALCKQANLEIIAYYPGGAMDFTAWKFHELVALEDCLSYRIKVRKAI